MALKDRLERRAELLTQAEELKRQLKPLNDEIKTIEAEALQKLEEAEERGKLSVTSGRFMLVWKAKNAAIGWKDLAMSWKPEKTAVPTPEVVHKLEIVEK